MEVRDEESSVDAMPPPLSMSVVSGFKGGESNAGGNESDSDDATCG